MSNQVSQQSMADLTDVDPYPYYDSVRAKGALVWDESMKGWLVTSFAHCRDVEMHEELYRHPYADASPEPIEIKAGTGGRRNITISQGEEHAKIHRWLLGLFAPRAVEQYREQHIRPILRGLLDRFVDRGRVELTAAYGNQIPPRVLMSLFAMPWDDDMVDAISMLLDRVKNLRLDPAAEQPVFRFHYTRSFRPLHVLFDPA